ncbi:MAG TPA: hypothetical protein VMU59_04510 [Caulobacteraceae bacterium]|nr:hypothetical protein [Caulobacteraceae bacterium]
MSKLDPVGVKGGSPAQALFDGGQALRLQMGLTSPLWLLFLGAASAGAAAWSMSRWTSAVGQQALVDNVIKLRLVKPSAVLEPAPAAVEFAEAAPVELPPPEAAPVPVQIQTPVVEAVQPVAPPVAETVIAPEPASEAAEPKPAPKPKSAPARAEAAPAPKAVEIKAVEVGAKRVAPSKPKAAPASTTAAGPKAGARPRARKP